MRRLVPVIFLVALVVLAGCGSSSEDSSSATETTAVADGEGSLTKAEFIAKADALCETSRAKQQPLRQNLETTARKARREEEGSRGVSDGTRNELARTLDRIVALAAVSLSRVQGLGAPKADRGQLETIFQKTETAFETSRAYSAALESHEDAKAQAIAEEGDVQTRETAALAKRYGFRLCGSQP